MAKYGILTSGGDAPGMNAAIRAAVRAAVARGHGAVAYLNGYSGLVADERMELDDRRVGNVIHQGGTFIGTSRCQPFLEPATRAVCAEQMRDIGVDGLVVIGGDGSFRGALALEQETGMPVVGVPGTIDNDIFGTDESIGFDTAVNTAVRLVDMIRDTGESTGRFFYVEVMGRASGEIALHAAVAAGAAGVLVPETASDIDDLCRRLEASLANGKRSQIIIVAEGDEAGGAFDVAAKVAQKLDHEFRVAVLGHIQRGGAPSARDRIVATRCGAAAMDGLIDGESGMMFAMLKGDLVKTPLAEVVAMGHPQPGHEMLELAERLSR